MLNLATVNLLFFSLSSSFFLLTILLASRRKAYCKILIHSFRSLQSLEGKRLVLSYTIVPQVPNAVSQEQQESSLCSDISLRWENQTETEADVKAYRNICETTVFSSATEKVQKRSDVMLLHNKEMKFCFHVLGYQSPCSKICILFRKLRTIFQKLNTKQQ